MTDPAQPHVLVVDDDPRLRALLQKFLARSGFMVTAARDAAHARRLIEGLEFDLIVLDVMMPGENGLRLTASSASKPVPTTTSASRSSRASSSCASTPSSAASPSRNRRTSRRRRCTSARCATTSAAASSGAGAR